MSETINEQVVKEACMTSGVFSLVGTYFHSCHLWERSSFSWSLCSSGRGRWFVHTLISDVGKCSEENKGKRQARECLGWGDGNSFTWSIRRSQSVQKTWASEALRKEQVAGLWGWSKFSAFELHWEIQSGWSLESRKGAWSGGWKSNHLSLVVPWYGTWVSL